MKADVIVIVILLALFALVTSCEVRDAIACEKLGGVYLQREWKCIRGERIRLP